VVAYFPEYEPEISRPRLGRGWVGWVIITFLAIAIGVTLAQPTNLAIEQPGPVFDTLGTTTVDEEAVPVIDIPMETSYPTTGSLDMLTVQTIGTPESPATVGQVVGAWLDKSQAIIPLDELYPPGQTGEQSAEISKEQMLQSQQDAIAAALTVVGRDYSQVISVVEATAGGASDGILQKDDVLQSINGVSITSLDELRQALDANGTEHAAVLEIVRDGAPQSVKITPTVGTGEVAGPVLGIQITTTYKFPFEVQIQLDRVGGPSAGQIFALAIIDKLTPGALTGGNVIAGTGTVDADGTVGAIGGIQQKMFAAKNAGAKYFLAPESNCDEVTGHIPNGLQVFAVKNLGDSLSVLNTVSSGASTSLLATCPID
jgi:Lon-like protease